MLVSLTDLESLLLALLTGSHPELGFKPEEGLCHLNVLGKGIRPQDLSGALVPPCTSPGKQCLCGRAVTRDTPCFILRQSGKPR